MEVASSASAHNANLSDFTNKNSNHQIYYAIKEENIEKLIEYKKLGYDFNFLDTFDGETFLQTAIKYNKPRSFETLVEFGVNINNAASHDGTTALHEAVRLGSTEFTYKLINLSANANVRSVDGFTPLNYALAFKKYDLVEVLLKAPQVDVNIPSAMGSSPIWYAFTHEKYNTLNDILNHDSFDPTFNRILLRAYNLPELHDYLIHHDKLGDSNLVNIYDKSKLFGLKFDLGGCMPLNILTTHEYGCFVFDGYYKEMGVVALADSYNQFYSKVISQSLIPTWASQAFVDIKESLIFSASTFEPASYYNKMMRGEMVIIPSGWDKHSITFVIHNDSLYRCNRGDESDRIHGIEEFKITKLSNLNIELIDHMLSSEGTSKFLQYGLIDILGLQKIGMVENPTQLAGNCVWTSLETSVEAAFISHFLNLGIEKDGAHQIAKESFLVWEEFDLTYTLKEVIDHKDVYKAADIYDDLLIRSLETHHDPLNEYDVQRGIFVLNELDNKTVVIEYPDFSKACANYPSVASSLSIDNNVVLDNSFIEAFEQVFAPYALIDINHALLLESTEHFM